MTFSGDRISGTQGISARIGIGEPANEDAFGI